MRGNRTLVIEDHVPTRNAMVQLLHALGLEAQAADSVGDAMALLEWPPTAVVLDLELRNRSGVDVLRKIRDECRPIAVAVVSGSQEFVSLDEVARLHPDVTLLKPVVPATLIDWLTADDETEGKC